MSHAPRSIELSGNLAKLRTKTLAVSLVISIVFSSMILLTLHSIEMKQGVTPPPFFSSFDVKIETTCVGFGCGPAEVTPTRPAAPRSNMATLLAKNIRSAFYDVFGRYSSSCSLSRNRSLSYRRLPFR